MPRYRLTVAYDGTSFHGWQRQQARDGSPLRTVQGVLEDAVSRVVRETVTIRGASRTDAGVHARAQVAAFMTATAIPLDRLPQAINSRLPDDVQVREAALAAPGFDPVADCLAKGYQYRIAYDCALARWRPLFDRHYVAWTACDLDPARMDAAARHLVGRHDFASFTRVHHGRESTVRTVLGCRVCAGLPGRCRIDVSGDGFLYNMVRIIAGTLVEVGRGRIDPGALPEILAARDRAAAGPTLPPEGLCLMWTRYPGEQTPVTDAGVQDA